MRSTNPIKMHTNGLLINMYFNLQEQGPSTGEFCRHYRVLHQFMFRNRKPVHVRESIYYNNRYTAIQLELSFLL